MGRGRDGLHRRGNVFGFRYKDPDGVWRERSTGASDRKEARDERKRFLEDLEKGIVPTHMKAWRLGVAAEWWKEYREPRIARSTWEAERYRLDHFVRILRNKKLEEISSRDLDDYVTERLKDGITVSTVNKEVWSWGLILKKAKLWRRLKDDYKPLKAQASDIGRALTRAELRHLVEVAETNTSWEAAFYGSVLAANTGLRSGEIKKLHLGDIDLERRALRIRRKDAKTDASARQVELNLDAMRAVTRLILRARSLGSSEPTDRLMPKHLSRIAHGRSKGARGYDTHAPQAYWDTAWHSLTTKAGFPGLRFHDLRHTFITHMVEAGVPLGVIQSVVGHISSRMVRHYTHVTTGATRKAVEILDRDSMLGDVLPPALEPEAAAKPAARIN